MIVLDTNVYISALAFPKGKPYQILQMALAGDVKLAVQTQSWRRFCEYFAKSSI